MTMRNRVPALSIGIFWMIVLSARTLDDALEKFYQTKSHLRPTYLYHADEFNTSEQQDQNSACVSWDRMHRYIDLIALSYLGLNMYTTYQILYHSNDNRWLKGWDEYAVFSGLKKSSLCGSYALTVVPLAIKVYIYRMLAHMGLNLVRYGIVMPLAWMSEQLQEFNSYENFSRHRIVCDHRTMGSYRVN
jgi:hypothetical protein